MTPADTPRSDQGDVARAHRTFWFLVAATVVAAGFLSQALARPAGPGTAATVAVSGLAAVATVSLAGRIIVATSQRRVRPHRGAPHRRKGTP